MYKAFKTLLISAMAVNGLSFLFFFLLANRFFEYGFIMDVISTVILTMFGIPSVALIMGSIYLLKFQWTPKSWLGYAGLSIIIIALISIAIYLFSFAWRV
ncbi:hypothetical protein [Paenibacillus tepidiphilus]|uniref:hypothetical protein n=1 Tax=Paenibacillus tepidiphilus TaxID=2608683 RepID=UPI00123AA4DE|nr:hypothetical protein [Paenibacillus tepidiphilus]